MKIGSEQSQSIRFYGEDFYPNNAACTWLIQAHGSDQIVKANLTLHTDSLAKGDSIEVRDGNNMNASLIGKFTSPLESTKLFHIFSSSGQNLWIGFRSDEELTGAGFEITFSSVNKTKGIFFRKNSV